MGKYEKMCKGIWEEQGLPADQVMNLENLLGKPY